MPQPWSIDDAPENYIAGQLRAIVGVEIEIARLEGKWKLSQNRDAADRQRVVEALSELGTPEAEEIAKRMRDR